MKWVIAILLALNLWLGFYGFGQTFTTLNLQRDSSARELRSVMDELEAVKELLFSLDAKYSDEYMEMVTQRIKQRIDSLD